MNIYDIQQEIARLKKEKNICILAHSYQAHEILEVADYTGDSFQLSVKAQSVEADTVVMCGVRFMAETVKLLSPEKKVILSHPDAGCPMAEQMDPMRIEQLRALHPGCKVVAYVNTTAELKAVCDVCVTSSSAVKIVSSLPEKDILFIPDCNLGAFVAKSCPDKNLILVQGGCPVHAAITADEVKAAKAAHPHALLAVHPECTPEVTAFADYIGSTGGIMTFAKNSDAKEFIIGTDNSIAEHLQYECPDKAFYVLSKDLLCRNMRLTTLVDLLNCLKGTFGEEIVLPEELQKKARVCIDEMIALGG